MGFRVAGANGVLAGSSLGLASMKTSENLNNFFLK